jgi:antitoxin ChpS
MAKSVDKAPSTSTKATRTGRSAPRRSKAVQPRKMAFGSPGPIHVGVLARTRLKKSGGSLVITVPAPARNLLKLTAGQEMAVSVEGSKVVMEPIPVEGPTRVRRPKYTIDELVAGMEPDVPLTEEERAWMDEPPAGREVW